MNQKVFDFVIRELNASRFAKFFVVLKFGHCIKECANETVGHIKRFPFKLAAKCREYGLLCSIEPYGSCPADNLQYGQYVDIPMGEFWSNAANPYSPVDGNAKFVSYVAHVWGKPICATESFTASPSATAGRWMTTPFGPSPDQTNGSDAASPCG